MSVAQSPGEPRKGRRGDRAFLIAAVVLLAGFVIAFGARPAIVISTARLDDALFMQLGQSLAAGHWLGPYDERTLAKGLGFPLFLAAANLTGLAYPLALAILNAASAAFAAVVAWRLTGSRSTGLGLLAALLLAPVLYAGELMRVSREVFYASLTLAFASAAIALVTGCLGRARGLVVVTGLIGATAWLTREEGVWLAPMIVLLAFVPLFAGEGPWRGRLRALIRAGQALVTAIAAVVLVGLVNWAVYGRYEINEVKSSAFRGAVGALQEASAPFHRTGVPVPAAARAQIYAVSPAFATLRDPLLDGPQQAEATKWGCQQRPETCGDFGGGWFIWTLRTSAAIHGKHTDPAAAAAFYRTLAREVRRGCSDGRLTCRRWPVPLAPPMVAGDGARVVRSFGQVVDVMTFGSPVLPQVWPSDLSDADAEAQLAFLNRPAVQSPSVRRRLEGWFRGDGAQWFDVQAAAPVTISAFSRNDSPDLVGAFSDPRLQRQRFTLEVDCPAGACPVTVRVEGGGVHVRDLAALGAGTHRVGGASLHVDRASGGGRPLLKTRFSNAWIEGASRLSPLFRGLVVLGAAAYLALAGQAVLRRRLSTAFVVCTALLAAVLARAALLAVIDALSFSAANVTYALAAVPLLLVFSAVALHGAISAVAARRVRSA